MIFIIENTNKFSLGIKITIFLCFENNLCLWFIGISLFVNSLINKFVNSLINIHSHSKRNLGLKVCTLEIANYIILRECGFIMF